MVDSSAEKSVSCYGDAVERGAGAGQGGVIVLDMDETAMAISEPVGSAGPVSGSLEVAGALAIATDGVDERASNQGVAQEVDALPAADPSIGALVSDLEPVQITPWSDDLLIKKLKESVREAAEVINTLHNFAYNIAQLSSLSPPWHVNLSLCRRRPLRL